VFFPQFAEMEPPEAISPATKPNIALAIAQDCGGVARSKSLWLAERKQRSLAPTVDATAVVRVNGTLTSNGSSSYSIPLDVGNNTINIIVTAQDHLTTQSYTVTVYRGVPEETIVATNILTPNGDGKNDTWIIQDLQLYPNNTVTVFDKGGRVIFSKHGYNNDWDGTLKGAPLAQGTYYYTVDLGVGKLQHKGFITIIKSR